MDKETIKIIIIEDDKELQIMYEDSIEEFNSENENYILQAFHLTNDDEVPKLLYDNHIDAIIIDLDWGTGNTQNEGSKLVKKIYMDCRIPIFIVSGNLHLLVEEYEESPILKKYQRDDVDNIKLFKEIESLYKTGYTKALGNQSEFDKMISKVFWNHMFPVITSRNNKDFGKQRLLRFAVTRINEMLTINNNDEHDDYDALEFYIRPAIKDRPFTGDIISLEDKKYIVITAACDMEQDKSEYVVICKIDFDEFDEMKRKIKSDNNKAKQKMCNLINNNIPRYHLLPPCKLFAGGLVDFQQVKSVDKDSFYDKSTVIASINPVFHKDIQARFSHYYGRQGQPQLNKDEIINWMKEN